MTSRANKNELKLMHQNIQGYSGKEDEIQNYLQKSNIDILCLTEHWQSDENPNFCFKNYDIASSFCRKDHIRGGSTIVVKSGLLNQMENTCKEKIENLSKEAIIELSCLELKNQVVICAYTPSVAMYNQFEPVMKEALKVASESGKFVTVCGDFNVDLLRESSKRTRIIDLFNESGLRHTFQEPTRVTRNTATCIDNIFTNCDYTNKVITNKLKSDHSGQVVTFTVKQKKDECDLNNNYLLATITCSLCDRTFTANTGYLSHLRAHERNRNKDSNADAKSDAHSYNFENGMLTCPHCGRTFTAKTGFLSHMRAHKRYPDTESDSEHEAVQPNRKDKSPTKASVSREDNDSEIKCKYAGCDRTFESGAGYASHLRAHERQTNRPHSPRNISPSTKNSEKRNDSPIRTSVSRPDDSAIKCQYAGCDRTFESGAGYASHLRAHERQKTEPHLPRNKSPPRNISTNRDGSPTGTSYSRQDNSSAIKCQYAGCDRTFESGAGYASHLRAHERQTTELHLPRNKSPPRNISTNRDGSPTGTSYSRQDNNSAIKCQYAGCGRTFESGAGYASHLRAHERQTNEPKPLATVRLNETLSRTSISRQTNRTSGSESQYVCCGRTFASGAGYASHMRSHESGRAEPVQSVRDNYYDKPSQSSSLYSCCGRSFSSGAGYASHMRAHERERAESFQSYARNDYDSFSTASYSASRQSFGSSGGGQSGGYYCCGRSFASGAGYASHMRAHARN